MPVWYDFVCGKSPIIQTTCKINLQEVGFVKMAEYICRLGTPTGEVVTRTVEATAERDLRSRLEREGFRVFSIASTKGSALGAAMGTSKNSRKIKIGDF